MCVLPPFFLWTLTFLLGFCFTNSPSRTQHMELKYLLFKRVPTQLVERVPNVIPSPANISLILYICWCALQQVLKVLPAYSHSAIESAWVLNMRGFGCDRLETYCLYNRAARNQCVVRISGSSISREPDYLTRSLWAGIRRESRQCDQVEKSGVPRIFEQKST